MFLGSGSPFLERRGFAGAAVCCVQPGAEPAYTSGKSEIKSVPVKTAESDARTALSFILELQWFDCKRERLAYAIGYSNSNAVRFDVGASPFKSLDLDVSRWVYRSLRVIFF